MSALDSLALILKSGCFGYLVIETDGGTLAVLVKILKLCVTLCYPVSTDDGSYRK